MDWEQMRSHWERLFNALGTTQTDIAEAGGLRQPQISRVLNNRNEGPSAQKFINAIYGLGLPPSEFFKQIEQANASVDVVVSNPAPRTMQTLEVKRVEVPLDPRVFARAQLAFWKVLAGVSGGQEGRRKRRRE